MGGTFQMSATNDDKARQAVRERLAESLFVEAGAGTGKNDHFGRTVQSPTLLMKVCL